MGNAALDSFLDEAGALFGFCHEKIPGKGEDSLCYSLHEQGGIMAVFDGCGGSGAESYARLGNHSGAYLASRAAATATLQWFDKQNAAGDLDMNGLNESLKSVLSTCNNQAEQPASKIRGSLTKTLPTTMAAFAFQKMPMQPTVFTTIAAGDSHLYLLDTQGLKQLNKDDVASGDAFTNLYNDPPMTNVISLNEDFILTWQQYRLVSPCMLISATDGCFGYLKSPMEFELLLLNTLMESCSIDDWQNRLECAIDDVAGDDQTLLALVYGYGSFAEAQEAFALRHSELATLLSNMSTLQDGFEERRQIWNEYSSTYYSLAVQGRRS